MGLAKFRFKQKGLIIYIQICTSLLSEKLYLFEMLNVTSFRGEIFTFSEMKYLPLSEVIYIFDQTKIHQLHSPANQDRNQWWRVFLSNPKIQNSFTNENDTTKIKIIPKQNKMAQRSHPAAWNVQVRHPVLQEIT